MIMDKKGIYLTAVFSAFMLLGSTCLSLENQIINGEFDADIEPWQRSAGDGYIIEVVQGAGLSGTNALKIDVSNAEAQDYIVFSHSGIVIEQPTAYPIGFMAKAQSNREMLVLLERKQSTYWYESVELTTQPQTFNFKYVYVGGGTAVEDFTLSFVLKQPWWSGRNENANIDVYIDRVYFGDERIRDPNLACHPSPLDGAIHDNTWAVLSWSPGRYAVSHNVYLGNNITDVYAGTGDTFCGNLIDEFFVVGFPSNFMYEPKPGTTHYWRIDEVNDMHPDSPWKGDVWSFTITPRQAYAPDPADGAKSIDPNVELSWTEGFYAESHIVYFGDNFEDVNNATGGMAQIDTSYALNPLESGKTYYWRVDELDGYKRHKGDVWSFTTVPPTIVNDPNLVHSPQPPDNVMHKDTWASFAWKPGHHAASHDVYFGEDFNEVYNGTGYTFYGNQPVTCFVVGFGDFSGLMPDIVRGATYYWRIDEVNDLHPDSPWKGDVWSFWLAPYNAYDPIPADSAELIDPNVTLSWTAGFNVKLHTLYLGENSADVEAGSIGTHKGRFVTTKYRPDALESGKTYYWRVDEFDGAATHKGEIWNFTTVSAAFVSGGGEFSQ